MIVGVVPYLKRDGNHVVGDRRRSDVSCGTGLNTRSRKCVAIEHELRFWLGPQVSYVNREFTLFVM